MNFLLINTELYKSNSNGNFAGWIFLILFFSIIIILIVVAVVGSKKDRNEKLIENNKRKKLREEVEDLRIIFFVSLDKMIKKLEKDLKDFEPSIGIKSLGDINKEYSDFIKKIINSEEIKKIYMLEDYKTEIKQIIDSLSKNKPSNWYKNENFAINLIIAKAKSIKKINSNKELIKLGENKKWN